MGYKVLFTQGGFKHTQQLARRLKRLSANAAAIPLALELP